MKRRIADVLGSSRTTDCKRNGDHVGRATSIGSDRQQQRAHNVFGIDAIMGSRPVHTTTRYACATALARRMQRRWSRVQRLRNWGGGGRKVGETARLARTSESNRSVGSMPNSGALNPLLIVIRLPGDGWSNLGALDPSDRRGTAAGEQRGATTCLIMTPIWGCCCCCSN